MQRRAAAVSAAVFLLIAAGAYTFVGFAQEPTVDVEADRTLAAGETFTAGGTEYTVAQVGDGSASIEWTNESARYTATIENGSTVPAADVAWEGQENRATATLANGSVVEALGTSVRVEVAPGGGEVVLNATDADERESLEVGDTFVYGGEGTVPGGVEATVRDIAADAVTVAWGDPYLVTAGGGEVTFRQQVNATRVLLADDDAENQVLTTESGERFVRFADGSTVPLDEYLPAPERKTFAVGESLRYQGTEVTVASATGEAVTLEWFAPRTNTINAAEGDNVTVGGTTYLVQVEGSRLVLSRDFQGYRADQQRIEDFHERVNGLWAVAILAGLSAVLIVGLAYLPSRY
ncbi:MAG: hypothetical protein ABEH77_04900 [Halobacteriaceae archaeon]